METRTDTATRAHPAPEPVRLTDTATPYDVPPPAVHGCWYPSVDPGGRSVAFICDRAGVPQLWTAPVAGEEVRRLDADPHPVTEVSWSPDGRWIAYTAAPDGGELTRVLCVRPDGTGRHLLAGGEPGTSARLGCWQHDGSAVAVTVTDSAPSFATRPGQAASPGASHSANRAGRDGRAVLLQPGAARLGPAEGDRTVSADEPEPRALSAYLVDPEGLDAPVLLASERGAANQRVCDLSRDGRLALVYRGPRGRREALVVRTGDRVVTCALPVADGDPWIGGFSPDAGTVWLRSDGGREYAALVAARLDRRGHLLGTTVAAQRPDCDLELLALGRDGRRAVLAWNVRGVSELEVTGLTTAPSPGTARTSGATGASPSPDGELVTGPSPDAGPDAGPASRAGGESGPSLPAGPDGGAPPGSGADAGPSLPGGRAGDPPPADGPAAGPSPDAGPDAGLSSYAGGEGGATDTGAAARPASADTGRVVDLPHEVVTRIAPTADPDVTVVALSGSRRHPGVWWLPHGLPLRTPWSSRDEDAVPAGRTAVRPVQVSPVARDGLTLGGWYYRAPGRSPGAPAPCVLHLHGGPEEQERPVLEPLYLELLGRGLDVFAPDVRGSSGHGRSFVDADLGTGRFDAINDVADCAAHVIVEGLADPRRMAVMGRSYGGYLVMASLVWHPDLFRTGVAVCGMSDFATFFAGTEPWIAQSAAHKYGHPEHDRQLLHTLSPMSRIDALRAPVLAVHGEHDSNVPPGESEQFVRAARERGLEAELLLLRHEGHDFRRADNRRLFRRSAADWMERHLAD
ncbi:S9 family peptidase [Streptomyces sp. CHD11]|uniref:prolyl oligopeptidase family serine peptidase n=1 Tax=Streptomyces sp. CHD11 TaxID=2741325 RepID=UPI001BFCBD7C|nr:prolyl oligopeptidase family serine peptidase [Streptomyces sp. CHD11]MBT3150216.1 S9 family peptidase [Streptomyces sp. CHD11]